jgi:hypothetical protein
MQRDPERLATELDLGVLRDQTWAVFQRYVERVGEPPNFELFCKQPEFKDLKETDLEGVVRNTYFDLYDIWRRAGFQSSGDRSADTLRGKQGLQEPNALLAAVGSRLNNYRSHLFSQLEDGVGRKEALAFSSAIEKLPSLAEFYRRQNGSDLETLKNLAEQAIKDMDAVFSKMDERRKEQSGGGMDTSHWKSDAVKREREELRNLKDMVEELTKVIHHKLPRQFVAKLEELMTREQRSKLETDLVISGRREFLSLGSNLLLGPKARGDETGLKDKQKGIAAFDGTPTDEDGTFTPRSEALEQVYEELYPMLAEERTEPFSDIEFEKIAGLLVQAETLHYQASNGKVLDSPLGRWELKEGVYVKARQKVQDVGMSEVPLVALKGRAAPKKESEPAWMRERSLKSLAYEAQRKLCSEVLSKLHAVRVRVAELGEIEAIDTAAFERMRAVELFNYANDEIGEWVKRVGKWVDENSRWAEEQMAQLKD